MIAYAKLAALVLAATLGGWLSHWLTATSWQAKYNTLEAQVSADKLAQASALVKAVDANHAKTAQLEAITQQQEQERHDHQTQIDAQTAINRDLLARIGKLRTPTVPAGRGADTCPAPTNAPIQCDGAATGAGFWPALAEFATTMAADADANTQQLTECQHYVHVLREVINE